MIKQSRHRDTAHFKYMYNQDIHYKAGAGVEVGVQFATLNQKITCS